MANSEKAAAYLDNNNVDVETKELVEFLDDLAMKTQAVSEARGRVGARVKEIIGDTGWHKGAFGVIRKINAMSDTSRADFLRTFSALFDVMMQEFWMSEMQDLVEQVEAEGAD